MNCTTHRTLFACLSVLFATFCLADPYVPGNAPWGQNWSFTANNVMKPKVTLGGVGTNFWGITLAPVTNGQTFKITNGPGWTTNWGSGFWIFKDSIYVPGPSQGGGDMQMNNNWTAGFYAHLVCDRAQDGPANLKIGAMMLSATPVSITNVTDNAATNRVVLTNAAVAVSVRVSTALCAEEKVMVRYSTDGWSTKTIIAAALEAGNVYTASIPAQVHGKTGEYYAFTTTLPASSTDLQNNPDLLTISYDNNGGANFRIYWQAPPSQRAANFSGAPRDGYVPMTVTFTDLSTTGTLPLTSWNWTFGDGGTSTNQNPAHQYTNASTFNVQLIVSDGAASSTNLKTSYIAVSNSLPNVAYVPGDLQNFVFGTNNMMKMKFGLLGATADFWGITLQPVTNGQQFKITWGPSFATNWGSGFWIYKDDVAVPGPGQGGANMLFNDNWTTGSYAHVVCHRPQDGAANLEIGAMLLSAPPVSITNVVDDAPTNNVVNPGASVKVTARLGSAKCAEERVMVCYSFNYWATRALVEAAVESGNTYTASVPGQAVGVTGEFYVLTTTLPATSSNLINYTDLLTIDYDINEFGNYKIYWVVPPPLAAQFSGSPLSGNIPLTVSFTDQSTICLLPITSWQWSFGDGGTSTVQHPSHQYTQAGSYDVRLIVSDGAAIATNLKPAYLTASVPLPQAPYVVGDAAWGSAWSHTTNNAMQAKPGLGGLGTNFWGITVYPATNGQQFKITYGADWATNWGGGFWIFKDSIYVPGPGQGGDNMQVNNNWSDGFYAHLVCDRAQDGPTNLQLGAMMLSAPPVAIAGVTAAATATAGTAASVAIALGSAKCAEERVMLCYTINDWSGKTIVEAALQSANVYTAAIPGQVAGTTGACYAFTTTLPASSSDLQNNTDLLTINYAINAGANYHVVWTPSLPFVIITNGNFTVSTTSATIGGTSAFAVGSLAYTNYQGSIFGTVLDAGTIPAADAWNITVINLAVGDNVVEVYGTNVAGEADSDYITITRTSSGSPSDVADFVITLATADYRTTTLGWSNGTAKVLACTNQSYTSDLSYWFELASDVASPWTHQDASNYPVIFYRIVSGTYTSQYDVGKYTVTLTPGASGNPAYNWISPPLELFSNTVNYVLGNQLNYDASYFDVLQAQIPVGGAQIDNYYVDGTWTDGNDEPLTRFATGQGYILVVDATHETPKTVAFVGKVPAGAVTNMLSAPRDGNPAYNWIGAPTPALRGFFVNGLTNAVVTTETEQNFDVYQNQVTIGGAQKDWYYVAGQWDDGEAGTPLQTPGMGGILVLDQNHTSAATNWFAPKTR